jgi:hypothetical protein
MRDTIFIALNMQIVGTKDTANNLEGRVTQLTMPLLRRWFDGTKTQLARRWWFHRGYGLHAILTFTMQEGAPRVPILNKKKMMVKLNKDIIVRSKPMNRSKIASGLWHM